MSEREVDSKKTIWLSLDRSIHFERCVSTVDLMIALIMLSQPALFAEYIYPLLTPHGVLLAVYLLAWWRVGRALCLFSISQPFRRVVAPWLWLSSAPLHSAALVDLTPRSWEIVAWHSAHLLVCIALWLRRR